MVRCVRGNKAAASGTIIHQESNLVGDVGFAAGTQPEHQIFYEVTANDVTQPCRDQETHDPPNGLLAKINDDKKKNENIEGDPCVGLPQEGCKLIHPGKVPLLIDEAEEPPVPLQ